MLDVRCLIISSQSKPSSKHNAIDVTMFSSDDSRTFLIVNFPFPFQTVALKLSHRISIVVVDFDVPMLVYRKDPLLMVAKQNTFPSSRETETLLLMNHTTDAHLHKPQQVLNCTRNGNLSS